MYTDKNLVCMDCSQEFVFTARDQEFYAERSSEIRNAYIKAYRNKDFAAMPGLREEWRELQAGKRNQMMYFPSGSTALKVQPLSDLIKAPHAAAKRERTAKKDYDFNQDEEEALAEAEE